MHWLGIGFVIFGLAVEGFAVLLASKRDRDLSLALVLCGVGLFSLGLILLTLVAGGTLQVGNSG